MDTVDVWNYADLWERVADRRPDQEALVWGKDRRSWRDFDRAASGLAASFLDAGLRQGAKVAAYLYSQPEYLETYFAAFKASLVPVNVNYRYRAGEVHYILDNADAEAVVFGSSFTDLVNEIRDRLPGVRLWVCVDDAGTGCPDWATPYERAAAPSDRPHVPWDRSPDDLFFLYTGGTTGMPKAVMWRQDDVIRLLSVGLGMRAMLGEPVPETMADWERQLLDAGNPPPKLTPACPLMHGTGLFTAYSALLGGGTVVLLASNKYDAEELLDTTEREHVNAWAIVGDPFARPVADALDAHPGRWDLSSLLGVTSSGAMWTESVKQRILAHAPHLVLADAFSSSEAVGMAASVSTGDSAASTAQFAVGERTQVLRDDGTPVTPGSGESGMLAVHDFLPQGYYKDPEKTARTIVEYDGVRWLLSGDIATVDADGIVHVSGRGSMCINTAGEKVFVEEVEEALKTYPGVQDAIVVGVPDPQWGQAVTAIVQADQPVDEAAVIAHVKERLAAYKAPKRVLQAEVPRSPSGKADFQRAQQMLTA
ncbi:MAG TPA: AMP-binding protein [Mycobacteriales bacterium]